MVLRSTRKLKALMMEAGITGRDIARRHRVSETWVSLVINGHKDSPRILKAIADALGMRVDELPGHRRAA